MICPEALGREELPIRDSGRGILDVSHRRRRSESVREVLAVVQPHGGAAAASVQDVLGFWRSMSGPARQNDECIQRTQTAHGETLGHDTSPFMSKQDQFKATSGNPCRQSASLSPDSQVNASNSSPFAATITLHVFLHVFPHDDFPRTACTNPLRMAVLPRTISATPAARNTMSHRR